ncbi:MAG: hypothetical protein RLZZ528_1244 [Pseudomonadota bacterium]
MRDVPPFLSVYAGARLNISEDIRRLLSLNADCLAGSGIACGEFGLAGSDGSRDLWPAADAEIPGLKDAAEAIALELAPLAATADRALVLAIPDLPGTPTDILAGRFFPAVGARAAALRLALGKPVDRLAIVIRPYDDMFRIAWRHAAIAGEVDGLGDHARRIAGFRSGWTDVVEALADVLGTGEIDVHTMPADPFEVFSGLLPEPVAGLRRIEPTPELTDSAVAMIRRHVRQGVRFAPGQRERLIAFHARQPQDDDLSGLLPALALADLRGRYVADLSILSRTAGVRFCGQILPPGMDFADMSRREAI